MSRLHQYFYSLIQNKPCSFKHFNATSWQFHTFISCTASYKTSHVLSNTSTLGAGNFTLSFLAQPHTKQAMFFQTLQRYELAISHFHFLHRLIQNKPCSFKHFNARSWQFHTFISSTASYKTSHVLSNTSMLGAGNFTLSFLAQPHTKQAMFFQTLQR